MSADTRDTSTDDTSTDDTGTDEADTNETGRIDIGRVGLWSALPDAHPTSRVREVAAAREDDHRNQSDADDRECRQRSLLEARL